MDSRAFLVLSLISLCAGCWIPESYTRAKQVRTVVNLQMISHRLDDAPQERSRLSPRDAQAIVDSVNEGEDGWGNEILIERGPDRRQEKRSG